MDYTTIENKLTKDNPNDFMGKVVNNVIKNEDDLVIDLTKPGSILKETEVRAVKKDIWKNIIGYISEGFIYRDEYISIRLDISGVFEGEGDRFDHNRHAINLTIVPGKELKEAVKNIKPRYVKANNKLPEVEDVYDWGSNTNNNELTPGDTLEISGNELKIYTEPEGQGVFFINKSTGEETVATRLRTNEPKSLSLRVPDLEAGTYRIEIRNTTKRGKTIRTGLTPAEFTVK